MATTSWTFPANQLADTSLPTVSEKSKKTACRELGSRSTRIIESCEDDFMRECMRISAFECKSHAHSFCETSYTS
eukprot:jgi/Picsp_1/2823/NSC_01049-R1_---NA---